MSNVVVLREEEEEALNLEEKSHAILGALFPEGHTEEMFRVFLNNIKKQGKIYLPLCQSIAGLVNTPMDFKVQVEVREDKTVIYF